MRVLLAPSAFSPHRGGVEELTLKLAQHLLDRGVDVTIATNRHPLHLDAVDLIEGVPVRRVAFTAPGKDPRAVAHHLMSIRRVQADLDRIRPHADLVHVVCASTQLPAVGRWARRHKVPLVITTQGETVMDAGRLYQRSIWMRTVLRREAVRAAALTACSTWTRDETARTAPAFRSAEVVPNGVDPEDWPATPLPSSPVACAWGRHVPQKGFDLLLRAWPDVRRRVPGATLLLGGDGPDQPRLAHAAGDGVELVGPLDRQGVAAMLARSRVVVVPSRVEPFGIVAVEALAAGRSVVYSRHGGLGEATGGFGWAVDPEDAHELATAVAEALVAGEPRTPPTLRHLTWATITEQYLAAYDAALSAPV